VLEAGILQIEVPKHYSREKKKQKGESNIYSQATKDIAKKKPVYSIWKKT